MALNLLRVVAAVSPLALLEAGLWLSDYQPEENRFFDGFDGHRAIFARVGDQWQVAADQADSFHAQAFPADKPAREFRIFSVGDSITWGHAGNESEAPLQAYSERLELLLDQRGDGWDYRVINCGALTFASTRVRGVVGEALAHEPDLILASFGTSEFLEANARAARVRQRALRGSWLGRLRTVGLVGELLGRGSGRGWGMSVAQLRERSDTLRAPFVPDAYLAAGAAVDLVAQARVNLQAMVQQSAARGVPFVMLTVPSNVGLPPFAGIPLQVDEREEIEAAVREAGAALDGGDAARALARVEGPLARHPEVSALHFRAAEAHRALGAMDQAARHYRAARDTDACPLRATSAYNDMLRGLAAASDDLVLVDIDRLFDGLVPDGIPDDRLFVDRCHPKADVHGEMAASIAGGLEAAGLIPAPVVR